MNSVVTPSSPSVTKAAPSAAATPVVRTVSTSGLSALRIKISTPRLKTINSTSGAESAAQAQVKIERSSPNWNPGTGLGTWEALTLDNSGVILGKFGSKYTKGFRIELPVDGPWSIRVTRLTPDGDSYIACIQRHATKD